MTEEQFKRLLDQQAKTITDQVTERLDAQETRLDERLAAQEARLNDHMTEQMASFFGQVTRHLDERLDKFDKGVSDRIDHVQSTVDGIAKQLDIFQQEQTIINAHTERRFDQLSESTNIKWATD